MLVTGQGRLLISRKGRFTQFSNLVDDCEYQRGEQKTTVADLQGFWEMVNFQVGTHLANYCKITRISSLTEILVLYYIAYPIKLYIERH